MMNRWKWLVILLVVVSVAIVVATALLPIRQTGLHLLARTDLQDRRETLGIPFLDENMRAVSAISILLSLAMIGVLVLYAMPERMRRIVRAFPDSPARLLRLTLVGLLVVVLGAVASLISAMAVATFPVAVLLSAVVFLAGLAGWIGLAYTFGEFILRRAGWRAFPPVVAYLLGLLLLFAVARLPWIGPVLLLLTACLGLGTVVVSKFGSGKPWNLNPLLEDRKDE